MKGLKKKIAQDIRWLVTFADLITLLFCFFVYLSLFTKPTVSLKTHFEVSSQTISNLNDLVPDYILAVVNSMEGKNYSSKSIFVENFHKLVSEKKSSEYLNQIVLESRIDEEIREESPVGFINIQVSDPVEEDLEIPLFFSGTALKGPVNPDLCLVDGISEGADKTDDFVDSFEIEETLLRFDYMVPSDSIIIPAGETTASMHVCIIDDILYEGPESIHFQIGNVKDTVERGTIISNDIIILDDENPPEVNFEIERRKIYEGRVNLTVSLDEVSGLSSEIPIQFSGSAQEGTDYELLDPPIITISPYTEKGSIQLEITQEDVPLYATRTLIAKMAVKDMSNVIRGTNTKQVNTIIGALEMKDCSGINRFLRENIKTFSFFELNASKSRCILSLPSEFLFRSGSAELKQENRKKLSQFLTQIRTRYELEGDIIKVEGHTDDIPAGPKIEYENNWELSIARAYNVAMFMIKKNGYQKDLISITGHADTRPRESYMDQNGKRKNGTTLRTARRANRRVDLIFARPPEKEQIRQFFPDIQ